MCHDECEVELGYIERHRPVMLLRKYFLRQQSPLNDLSAYAVDMGMVRRTYKIVWIFGNINSAANTASCRVPACMVPDSIACFKPSSSMSTEVG